MAVVAALDGGGKSQPGVWTVSFVWWHISTSRNEVSGARWNTSACYEGLLGL